MPDQLVTTGLQVKSLTDILNEITAALQAAYGASINLNQNSPDAQLLNIYAQSASDMRQLLVAVYSSFSPLSAFGVTLDQRVAINGIARKQGTFTLQNVNITVSQALTLYGLDQTAQPVFTISDNAGNQFQLLTTQNPGGAGTNTYVFQAAVVGAVQTLPNTITNQVTVVLGVTTVNNPAVATSIGVNEETDAQLKIRHAQSFFLAAMGSADAVLAALLAYADVTDAVVIENTTDGTVNGVTAHALWCIVAGGTAAEIGAAIYGKKAPGCGLVGGQSVVVARPNGSTYTVKYDIPINQNIWLKFTVLPRQAGLTFDNNAIKTSLTAALVYKLNQQASIGDVINAMITIQPNAILTVVGVSTDGASYLDTVSPTTAQYRFVVDPTRITIS